MELLHRLLHTLTDVEGMIRWGGYAALATIIFSETGLMLGFFLPGDSLLVAAGLFAGRGDLDLVYLWALLVPMAIAGNSTGYAIGHRLGRALFARPSSRLFNRRHLVRTQLFYEQHGGKTIFMAQFLPILRTFAPVVAGVARMRYRRFVGFNVFGAICWVMSMTAVGYGLGRTFPAIAKRIELVMLVVIAVSLIPGFISSYRADRGRRRRRARFLTAMGNLVTALGRASWEGTPAGLQRLAGELPAPEEGPTVADGPRPAIEMVAAQSPPLAELSEAGGEVAGWELEDRFSQAHRLLCHAFGEPRDEEAPGATAAPGTHAQDGRRATWQIPCGSLALEQRCDDRHRLTLRVEPGVGAAAAAAR